MLERADTPDVTPPVTPPGQSLSGRTLRLFRFIMLAGVIAVITCGALGAELAARYYERHRHRPPDYFPSIYYPHRRLRYGLVPNLDYYGWFRINSLGFRGREMSAQKPPGVLRVVCLGGSTTFDTGTVGAPPWPEVLESELRQRLGTTSVEVFNLGIGGATSLDSLIDLQTRALAFNPDLVVLYQSHNDLVYSIPPVHPVHSTLFPLEDRPRSSFERWLTLHSLLYAKSEERVVSRVTAAVGLLKTAVTLGRSPEAPGEDRDHAMERGLRAFEANVTSIAAIARANRIPLALVKAVVPFRQSGQSGGECAVCDALPGTYGLEPEKLHAILDRYDQVLTRAAGGGAGVFYVSTDGFVPNEDRFYTDPVHFGPEGSLRMGTQLGGALTSVLQEAVKR